MFMIPLAAAISNALGLAVEKVILSKKRMPISLYLSLLFLFLFFISAVLSVFLGAIDAPVALTTKYIVLFLTMIALAVTANYLATLSVQKEKLHEYEMIMMLSPIVTIVLASIYSPTRVDVRIFIAAIVAAICLLVAKLEKGHFDFSRYSVNLLIAVVMMSVESLIINELLNVYSPVSLYAFRTGFVFLLYLVVFRPKFQSATKESFKMAFVSAVLGSLYMILRLYGYKDVGIVKTTLFLIISPIFLYFLSAKFFKEKIGWRTIVSSLIIIGCIAYVSYIDTLSH